MASKESDSIIEQRTYFKFRTKLGFAPKAIFEELVIVCQDNHLSYLRVCEWAARFRWGRLSVEDDLRPGPEFKIRTDENIACIKAIVDEDPHCSIKEIVHQSEISTGSVGRFWQSIFRCESFVHVGFRINSPNQRLARLKMSKELLKEYSNADLRRLYEIVNGDEMWISYNEPERKSATCTWVGKNDDGSRKPPSKKPGPIGLDARYYTIFFDVHGSVAQICLPKGQRVTGEYYATTCLAVLGHLAERHRAERHCAERTSCRRTLGTIALSYTPNFF